MRIKDRDLPIVCTDGSNDALTLADRDFRHKLTRFRPYRSKERDHIIMTGFLDEMVGDGMKTEGFLSPESVTGAGVPVAVFCSP